MYTTKTILPRNSKLNLYRIKSEDILFPSDNSFEKKLTFKNYLDVIYLFEKKEKKLPEYNQDGQQGQRSWLQISSDSITINKLGFADNLYSITKFGYWAWERFAEELPLNYIFAEEK